MFQEWGDWALDFQWKSEGFPDDVLGLRKGVKAKAEPVEGPEKGLGRATEPAVSLGRLMALGAMDSFACGSGALQRWICEGPESQAAGLELPGNSPGSQASAPFTAPDTFTPSPR